MFWQAGNASRDSHPSRLGREIGERLRLAMDFATLGAYDLGAPLEGRPGVTPVPSQQRVVLKTSPQIPQRVFLFARAQAACPHSAPPRSGCPHYEPRLRRLRRPSSTVPEQPCACGNP